MRSMRYGYLTLFGLGAYYLWRNRFQVQRFLESRGIDVPLSTRNLGDTIRSGAAKVAGSFEHETRKTDKNVRQAV